MSSNRSAAELPSAPAGAERQPPVRRLAALAWRGVAALSGLCAAGALLALAAVHWFILPHIGQWRSQVAERAGAALGVPVRIGAIRVLDDRWLPPIELRDVQVLDRRGVPALRLPRIVARWSPQALLSGRLVLESLRIEGADLDVRRDAAGRLAVAGFVIEDRPPGAADHGGAAGWILRQPLATLEGGTVRWTDALRGTPPLVLTQVRGELRNGAQHHDLTLQAAPPPAFGRPVQVQAHCTQPLFAAADDWAAWSGRATADWPQVDLGAVAAWAGASAPRDRLRSVQGRGAVRLAVDLDRGAPRGASLEVDVRDLVLPAADAEAEPLPLAHLAGAWSVRRDGARIDLAGRRIAVAWADGGASWPAGGDVAVALRLASPGAPWALGSIVGGDAAVPQADIGALVRLARALPLPASAHRWLADAAPLGTAQSIAYGWDGPPDAPTRYRFQAAIHGVQLSAQAASEPAELGRPGVRGLQATVDANERGGTAAVSVARGGTVDLPGVFEDPRLPIEALDGTLTWQWPLPGASERRRAVQLVHGRIATADVRADVDARWTSAPSGPGRLVLDAKLGRLRADRLARYLPVGIPASSRLYVARALRSGDLAQTAIRVDGELRDFPFYRHHAPGDGTFRVATQVEHVAFAFVPTLPAQPDAPAAVSAWPAFADVGGRLVMDRANVQWHDMTARWAGYTLTGVDGHIDDLGVNPVVEVRGRGDGPLDDLLGFVAATPLAAATGHVLERSAVDGTAALGLALSVPLASASSTTVAGTLDLAGCNLRMAPGTPRLVDTHGRLAFDEKGMNVVGGRAQVLGGTLQFQGGNPGGGDLRFTGSGVASAVGLAQADELGWLARLSESLTGRAAYRAALGFHRGQSELDVRSDLVGVASALPDPLGKPAEAPLPLHYQTALVPSGAASAPVRDTLRVDVGSRMRATFRRELGDSGDTAPRVLAGAIGIGAAPPAVPASGVAARAVLGTPLDIDAWTALDTHWGAADASPADAGVPARQAGAAAPSSPAPLLGGYAPTTLALQAVALHADGRHLDHVQATVAQSAGLWHADLQADQAQGRIDYRQPRRVGGAGRIEARLARLSLLENEASQVEQLLGKQPAPPESPESPDAPPNSLPSLDIVVDDFELRGKRLGRLEVLAENRSIAAPKPGESTREWLVQRLSIVTPDATLAATGRWLPPGAPGAAPSATSLDFQIQLADAGALLTRLGTENAIAGGKGAFGGHVTWLGSPLSPDWPSLGGQLHLAVDDGRFLKVEPGAARLLGVLSLQALPRRLALDFRDVFEQGFAFDNAVGDIRLDRGVARTNNLRMRGVQAAVLVAGSADIERETQALHVVVVPEISAGTASLAYAVINPAIGLGAFLAQLFLKKPLAQAGTREFAISGPWSDPKVERLERRRGATGAAAAAAPSASAASASASDNVVDDIGSGSSR